MEISEKTAFANHVQSGVEMVCEELRKKATRITGFALCTDDGVSTLFHIATTKSPRAEGDLAEFKRTRNLEIIRRTRWAVAVDWELQFRPAAADFDRASDLLINARKNSRLSLPRFRREAFLLVCDTLAEQRARLERVADPSLELLLLFVSTGGMDDDWDPEMANRLNSTSLASLWVRTVFGKS